jgi:hypothetical protein
VGFAGVGLGLELKRRIEDPKGTPQIR